MMICLGRYGVMIRMVCCMLSWILLIICCCSPRVIGRLLSPWVRSLLCCIQIGIVYRWHWPLSWIILLMLSLLLIRGPMISLLLVCCIHCLGTILTIRIFRRNFISLVSFLMQILGADSPRGIKTGSVNLPKPIACFKDRILKNGNLSRKWSIFIRLLMRGCLSVIWRRRNSDFTPLAAQMVVLRQELSLIAVASSD